MAASGRNDWTRPQALAIPKEGYFKLEQGKYGPVFPRTPACHGFTIIAKSPGREQVIREYGKTERRWRRILPSLLAQTSITYDGFYSTRKDTYFMYQGIFDTEFDKYTDDAVALFTKKRHLDHLRKPGRLSGGLEEQCTGVHQVRSGASVSQFPEYGEYPYVTADEIGRH